MNTTKTKHVYRPLIIYLILITVISSLFIGLMKFMGVKGYFLAQFYMMGPAIAAIVTRLWFYENKFKDAGLKLGKPKYWLWAWLAPLGLTVLSLILMTMFGAIKWDFTGETFLSSLSQMMNINNLPEGLTPHIMLLLFFIGGLTVFNIPGIITGFGEEFGWRGFMFPQLYKIKPWAGFVVGGLIWFAWHIPLTFVFPSTQTMTSSEQILNYFVTAIGAVSTFILLAYVYVKTGSIFVASFAHIVMNNSSRSFSYFVTVTDQFGANIGLYLAVVVVLALLYYLKELRIFKEHFVLN